MTRHETRHGEAPQTAQDVRDTIAVNLKAAQEAAGKKTEQLSRETGISLRLVQKHRAGDNAPSHEYLLRYASALGKTWTWFLEPHDEEQAA